MSHPSALPISCPKCQTVQQFMIWDSLNATLNPDEKAQLLKSELARFTCDVCGHTEQVTYPFLYHDMQHSFLVWLIPPNLPAPDDRALENLNNFGTNYRMRTVETQAQLIEKIVIFEADLDDRIVELAKIVVAGMLPPEDRNADTEVFLSAVIDHGADSMMNFLCVSPRGTRRADFNRDWILKAVSVLCPDALKVQPIGQCPRIDRQFALLMLRPAAQ